MDVPVGWKRGGMRYTSISVTEYMLLFVESGSVRDERAHAIHILVCSRLSNNGYGATI